jgi:hypothetical protein
MNLKNNSPTPLISPLVRGCGLKHKADTLVKEAKGSLFSVVSVDARMT